MTAEKQAINMTELLIQISKDVAVIKTDMANFKEVQKAEKENISKALLDVRSDYKRDLKNLEAIVNRRLLEHQTVQNSIVADIDTLKHSDTEKDAKKWHTVLAFFATAAGGMITARLPDIVAVLLKNK